MLNSSKYNEQDNDWAFDEKEDPIHITQAESGANGYFCMGCTKPMQAVKGLINKHYFRHHAKDIERNNTKCVFASRVYREKLAAAYFHRVKEIKLPSVFKYPPRGVEGYPYLLEDSKTLKAHSTKSELTFYENEEGEVKWGKNPEIDERYLLVRPDMVFFDETGKPILFLEFVITHKPDANKLSKLKRLGINTVQIIVPKLPTEEIEKSISKVSKIKWVYHEIESNTEYLSIFSRNTEGVPSIDEEQRKLFEESYKCRSAQLKNLIRAINRSLESQSYKGAERLFEQEISRIEKATGNLRAKLDEIQAGIEAEIHSELGDRRDELDKRREKFRKKSSDLGERYFKRRGEIKDEEADTEREIKFKYGDAKTEDDIRREFSFQERDVDSEEDYYRREEERIIGNIESIAKFERSFGEKEGALEREFEKLEKEERENLERKSRDFESKINENRELPKEEEDRIRDEFEGIRKQVAERINNRDIQGNDELSDRIKTILELWRVFDDYQNGRETLERCRKGMESFKNGTWKTWD